MNTSSSQQGESLAKGVQQAAENESQGRSLSGLSNGLVSAVALAFGLFQIYTAGFGSLPTVEQRAMHMGFSLIIIFLLNAAGRKAAQCSVPWYDWIMILLSIAAMALAFFSYDKIIASPLSWPMPYMVLGAIAIFLVLEGTRRSLGLIFPALVAFFLIYALVGPWVPGMFHHKGVLVSRIIEMSYLNTTGLWGTVVGLSATLIATFILFGSLLLNTGAGETFFNVAMWISGRSPGGPAKVAVIASMLFGMISGSAAANVATTGTFTIPLMKRSGYKPEFAAATEAVASTGGQIMPPIMGAAAFIMAQFLGMSYSYIALIAVLPSAIYYFGTFMSVHFEALRTKMGTGDLKIPATQEIMTWKKLLPLLGPLGTLFTLFALGYSPGFAGFYALATTVVLAFVVQVLVEKQQLKLFFAQLMRAFRSAAQAMAGVALLVAAAEIVVGLVALTGISVKIGFVITSLAGSSTLLALVLAAGVTMLFGMGLPTTAAYMLGAAILAPALIGLGFDPLPAHFFVFYYAVLAVITPPVCAAVFIGAGIARTSWTKTSAVAMTMAIPAYLLPFVWMFDPAILLQDNTMEIVIAAVNVFAGTLGFAIASRGYLFAPVVAWQRALIAVAGVLLYLPEGLTSLIGWVLIAGVALLSWRRAQLKPDGDGSPILSN